MNEERFRLSVLHVARDTDLPLPYAYLPDRNLFQTMGYVRLRGITVVEVSHVGQDTADDRDRFLLKVLISLLVPPREAQRIVRTADHSPDRAHRAEGPPPAVGQQELGGLHMRWPGLVVGLLSGLLVGGLLAGWNGAVIGGFVGASTVIDLFVAGWQVVHARSPRNYVEIHDTLAGLMVTGGTITGGVFGYLLGGGGFGQARGVFLGMALAAFILGLLATTFSMVPFRQRSMSWLGPLIVGAVAWAAYSLWSSPVSLVLGIVLGSGVAGGSARRINGADW